MHPLGSVEPDVKPSAVTRTCCLKVLLNVNHVLRSAAMSLSGADATKSVLITFCNETGLAWVFIRQYVFDVGDIYIQDSTHPEVQQSLNGHHAIFAKHGLLTAWPALMTVNVT